jgi:hypothetical protein
MIQTFASVVTAVGVVVAAIGLRQVQRQRLRQFEGQFVARYWVLMDRLSLQALRGDDQEPHRDDDERVVRAYFRLCEDELELRREGWITDATWAVWAVGIEARLQRWPFRQIWDEVTRTGQERGTADFTCLHQFCADHRDPCQIAPWRRIVRGLRAGPG